MATNVPSSEITSRPPAAEITRELVQPPTRAYLTISDRLYIRSRNSLAGVSLTVAGRLLNVDGEIVPFNFEHTPATDRTATLEAFRLAEGYLLSAVVFPSAGAPMRGQTFVELGLLRGVGAAGDVVDLLAKDYVAEAEPLAFPGSPIRSSVEGPGAVRSITGTDRAAGVEISETVPTDARWRLISMVLTLVADATVTSRFVELVVDDGANVYVQSPSAEAQLADQVRPYWAASHGRIDIEFPATILLPLVDELIISAGHRIRTSTTSLQAGDNFSAPQLLVEEWIQD